MKSYRQLCFDQTSIARLIHRMPVYNVQGLTYYTYIKLTIFLSREKCHISMPLFKFE